MTTITDIQQLADAPPRSGNKVAVYALARMNSCRFPGKVILPLDGHPCWWHCLNRAVAGAVLAGCEIVGRCIVATGLPNDDILEGQAREYGVDCLRVDPPGDMVATRLAPMNHYEVDVAWCGPADSPFAWYAHAPALWAAHGQNHEVAWCWPDHDHNPRNNVTRTTSSVTCFMRWLEEFYRLTARNLRELELPKWYVRNDPERTKLLRWPAKSWQWLPDNMYSLPRPYSLELDCYQDAPAAMFLYDLWRRERPGPNESLVDAAWALEYMDAHPELQYNRKRQESWENEYLTRMAMDNSEQEWQEYCARAGV